MIYLDNAATTRPFDEVIDVMGKVMREDFANPSSLHHLGVKAEEVMVESRKILAGALQVDPGEVYFTSGGTETNNLVVKGAAQAHRKRGRHIITSAIEHKSVLNTMHALEQEGYEVTYVPVDSEGLVDLQFLEEALREDTILVSIMHVNNETGAIQPVDRIEEILRKHHPKPLFHVDAVQSFARIPLHPHHSDIDLLTLNSHKIHGPKGIGALFKRQGVNLAPLLDGGKQEGGLRSGTENLPGIAGFARAAQLNFENIFERQNHMSHLRYMLRARMVEAFDQVVINTPDDRFAAPHILNVSFPGLQGEVLLRKLETAEIYVSTGSACTSGKNTPSHVLKAMGRSKEEVQGALRFSFSAMNREEELEQVMKHLVPAVEKVRKMMR
ncbi:MAG: cysteine desulfurase [Bacteroidales bacterium]|nr:cysteine desulfurase [Bacteroidales bacterium]